MDDYLAFKFPMSGPDDMSGLEALLDSGQLNAAEVMCIIAKTEGNGRVNDYSRPLAHRAFRDLICSHTGESWDEADRRIAFVMSGGCEGIMSPHATLFAKRPAAQGTPSPGKRLAFAMANTRELLPEELGTRTQVNLVADAVREALKASGIAAIDDVHYVQVKCPLLTSDRIAQARARGKRTVTEDTLRSMGFSNSTSALGIAVGLGEIKDTYPDSDVCTNPDLYTTRGGCSSGIELMRCQVFVIGNSSGSVSKLVASHHRLTDLIDGEGVRAALRAAGVDVTGSLSDKERDKVVNIFAKGQVSMDGRLRGCRTTLLTDSDLNTRPARAVVAAMIASITGDPMVYVSAGWGYHQGPASGGIAAVIAQAG